VREKVTEELAKLRKGDVIEVKFIDACRFNNVSRHRITENRVFATYKRVIGEYFTTAIDMMYGEPFLILIVEQTDSRVDIVSIPERCVQRIEKLRRNRPTVKDISNVGAPMLSGSDKSRFRQIKKGVGEYDQADEETLW